MANDTGLVALNRRFDAIQNVLAGDFTAAGHEVGKGARKEATTVARSVTGGDGVLSHMGRKGARLGMRYDVAEQGRRVTLKLTPAGPWVLTERGAKPHTIKPRRRASGWGITPAMWAPSFPHPVSVPVGHPGTRNTQTGSIRRALGRMRVQAPIDFHAGYLKQLAKVMS